MDTTEWVVKQTDFIAITTTTLVAAADPTRVYLGVFLPIVGTTLIGLNPVVAGTAGMGVTNSSPLELWYSQHGGLTQQAFYNYAAASHNVTVIEVFYRPIADASGEPIGAIPPDEFSGLSLGY